jgi:hypothetical protein
MKSQRNNTVPSGTQGSAENDPTASLIRFGSAPVISYELGLQAAMEIQGAFSAIMACVLDRRAPCEMGG